MNIAKMLLKFCSENHKAIITDVERQKIVTHDAEVDRITAHAIPFGVGKAKQTLVDARNIYAGDPSEANRAALDKVQACWMEQDNENSAQRRIIMRTVRAVATVGVKSIAPPILRRAANSLAWMVTEEEFHEKARHALYDVPYKPSQIVTGLISFVTNCRLMANRIEDEHFEADCRFSSINAMDWLPDLLNIEGETWDGQTVDPAARRESKRWRNIGQCGNPLFVPMLCENGATAAAAEKGTGLVKYPDATMPVADKGKDSKEPPRDAVNELMHICKPLPVPSRGESGHS